MKPKRGHYRDERNKFHAPERRQAREDLFLKLSRLMLEENRGIAAEDRLYVLNLVHHKLKEKKEEV